MVSVDFISFHLISLYLLVYGTMKFSAVVTQVGSASEETGPSLVPRVSFRKHGLWGPPCFSSTRLGSLSLQGTSLRRSAPSPGACEARPKPCAPTPAGAGLCLLLPARPRRLVARLGLLTGPPGASASRKPPGRAVRAVPESLGLALSPASSLCSPMSAVIVAGVPARELSRKSVLQACIMPAAGLPNE